MYSIISSFILIKPESEKLVVASTVTVVATAVSPLPSFIAVEGNESVVPLKTPAPHPVPKKFVSNPVFI